MRHSLICPFPRSGRFCDVFLSLEGRQGTYPLLLRSTFYLLPPHYLIMLVVPAALARSRAIGSNRKASGSTAWNWPRSRAFSTKETAPFSCINWPNERDVHIPALASACLCARPQKMGTQEAPGGRGRSRNEVSLQPRSARGNALVRWYWAVSGVWLTEPGTRMLWSVRFWTHPWIARALWLHHSVLLRSATRHSLRTLGRPLTGLLFFATLPHQIRTP